jgi:ribonuclease T2
MLRGIFAAALLAIATASHAAGTAGDFDFYVLSLSWSPTYCATDDRPNPTECGQRLGFTVHGFWPEYENGYPEYCPSNMPRRVRDQTVAAISDLMPSAGLINHEWQKHGVCSGLNQDAYFGTLRKAYEKVALPPALKLPKDDQRAAPRAIEQAFIAANPRLVESGIAVTCDRGMLDEVRVCLTRKLEFRRCPAVDRQGCRLPDITVPKVR